MAVTPNHNSFRGPLGPVSSPYQEANMTTPNPEDFINLAGLKDRESLQFVGRILESQRVVLEAQLSQMKALQDAVQSRMQTIK